MNSKRIRSFIPAILAQFTVSLFTPALSQIDSQSNLRSAREEQDYAFATGLYKDKLYQLSSEQFDAFLRKYPTSVRTPDALFLRAECSFFQKDYETALSGYRKLISEYPASMLLDDALFRSGHSHLSLSRPEQAVTMFKLLLDEHGDSPLAPETAYWIGDAYDRWGDRNNALKYFTLAYEHFQSHPFRGYAMYAAGWTLQKERKFDQAIKTYTLLVDSMSSDPLVPSAKVRIGECLYGTARYPEAVTHLTRVLTTLTDPVARADAQYMIAESKYRLNDYSAAEKDFRSYLSANRDHAKRDEALFALGWTFLKREKYDSAATYFGKLAFGDGSKAHESAYRLSYALRKLDRADSAMTILRMIPDKQASGILTDDALVDLADLHLRRKEYFHARGMAQRVTDAFPESNVRGDAFWIIGEANLAEGDPLRARPFFLQALTSPASGPDIHATSAFRGATCAFQSGYYDTSSAEFGAFVNSYPNHPKAEEATYWQAESDYRRGAYDRASASYAAVQKSRDPRRRSDALYGLGWSEYKLGRFSRAAEAFGTLIAGAARGPMEYDARMRQADAFYAMKDYAQAEGAYRTVVRLYPDTASNDMARYQAGQCAFRRDDFSGAFRQFEDLVKSMPSSPLADDAQYAMGWINFRRKQYGEAIKEFQKVINRFPAGDIVPRAYYSLGDCYYNLGQYSAAEKSYRELLRMFPESEYIADAVTGMQYCLQAQGKPDDALGVIDKFLAENKNSSASQSLALKKGEILLSRGHSTAAKQSYEAFLVSYPKSPLRGQAHYWLGKTEVALNNSAAAFDAFRRGWTTTGPLQGASLLEALDLASTAGRTEDALSLILEYEKTSSPLDIRPEVSLRKGRLFLAEGNADEARRIFEGVIVDFSSNAAASGARLALARMALSEGRPGVCRSLAEQVASGRTDDAGAEGQFLVGSSYLAEKKWKDATTAFLRIRYVYPSSREWNDRAQLGLASAYIEVNEKDKAKGVLDELLKGEPDESIRSEAARIRKDLGQ